MFRHLTRAFWILSLLAVGAPFVSARDRAAPAAVLELLLPKGATATLDGKAIDNPRAVSIADLKPNEVRRVKVAVTFADGSSDDRLVDVLAGQQLRVAVPQPGPDRAMVVGAHPLVPINSAAVSPDGRFIALGLDSRTVVVWDTAAGRPVRSLVGHQKPVLAVAFSPDGKKLLSGSADATAILWDVEAGAPLRTYKGHSKAIPSVAFAPDGKRFLTGSHDGTAIVWETDTGKQVHKLNWKKEIFGVAYSPDGNALATASVDYTATLWDAKTGGQTSVLRGHREDVNCIAFSPDGKRVVTGSSEDLGIVWDAVAGKRITRTGRHTNNVHSAAFTPDGLRVITGEREELVMMWDAATGAPARTFVGHGAEILSIVPCLGGTAFLTGSRDGTARLWDLGTGRELLALTTGGDGREWAAASPDGLFDGTDAGRRALAYRFPKGGFGELDRFFVEGYRPGLLAEVWRGQRPFPANPPGRDKPPLVKLVAPKDRFATAPSATLTATVTDQGGGISSLIVENNGIRLNVPTKGEPAPDGKATRVAFTVPLAPGTNRIGVRSATRNGVRESAGSEVELTHPQAPGRRGRLYVVAVGIGEYSEPGWNLESSKADARALAELLRSRGDKQFDRVDAVHLFDREATRAAIEDTVKDVAELTRPQDALVVLLCGRGARAGDRVYFAPHDLRTGADRPEDAIQKRGVRLDDIASAMGTARALGRVLVVDAAGPGDPFGRAVATDPEFGLRGTVERWGRDHGLHVLAGLPVPHEGVEPLKSGRGSLAAVLRESAGTDAVDAADWLHSAAERTAASRTKLVGTRPDVQVGTRAKSFPLLGPRR